MSAGCAMCVCVCCAWAVQWAIAEWPGDRPPGAGGETGCERGSLSTGLRCTTTGVGAVHRGCGGCAGLCNGLCVGGCRELHVGSVWVVHGMCVWTV